MAASSSDCCSLRCVSCVASEDVRFASFVEDDGVCGRLTFGCSVLLVLLLRPELLLLELLCCDAFVVVVCCDDCCPKTRFCETISRRASVVVVIMAFIFIS